MNSHKSTFTKIVLALAAFFACFAFGSAPAGAAEHFLKSPVPVQPQPLNSHPSGGYDFVEAANGEAVAVWGQSTGLFVSVRLPGGAFRTPVLAVPGQSYSANPDLAITPSGYTVMTWRQDVMGVSQVMRAVRQAGAANFGPALQVSDEDFQIPNIDPHVDVADDGLTLLTWKGRDIDGDENSTRVRKRFLTPTGDLNGAISNVSPVTPAGVASPEVFMGPTGFALITWVNGDTITGDPATAWMQPGGGAQDVQVFDTNSGSSMEGAVDADGNAVIANRIGNDVIGNSRPAGVGQNFLSDQGLDLPATTAFTPLLEMDEKGVTTVAIPYFSGGQEGIQTIERPAGPGQLFANPATEAIPESDDVSAVTLAVGEKGLAILGFTREDDRVYAASRDAGAPGFGVPAGPVSPAGQETAIVLAGADGQGKGIVTYSTLDVPADDYSISALPYDDVPVAGDLKIPATVEQGKPAEFSVTPSDAWSTVTGVEWEVDQGVTKTGNQVTHTYATPGERMVVVKITDSLGNETTAGGPIKVTTKPVPPPDKTKPKLTRVSMLKKKSKRGKKNAFRFTLSEKARIQIKVKRISKGKGRKAQGKIVRKNVAAGKRRIVFKGKVNKRVLRPARYRATIVAVDGAGNRSKPRNLTFRIIR